MMIQGHHRLRFQMLLLACVFVSLAGVSGMVGCSGKILQVREEGPVLKSVAAFQMPAKGESVSIYAVAFGLPNTFVAAGSADGNVYVWDVKSGHLLATLKAADAVVLDVAVSADGRMIAAAAGRRGDTAAGRTGGVTVWEAEGFRQVYRQEEPEDAHFVSLSDDGALLAWQDSERRIHVQRLADGKMVASPPQPWRAGVAFAFGPGRRLFADGGIWEVTDSPGGLDLRMAGTLPVDAVSSDGQVGVYARSDYPDPQRYVPGAVLKYDAVRRRRVVTLVHRIDRAAFFPASLAVSPHGKLVALGGGAGGRVWDLENGQELWRLEGHGAYRMRPLNVIQFSPDGRTLVGVGSVQVGGVSAVLLMWRLPE